jgi:hypothetical protein
MSKKTIGYALKGTLDFQEGTLTETTKEAELIYPLLEIIKQFDGQEVTISIRLETEVEQADE